MEFKIVTEEEILNIINSLDNKSSSGWDGLSNTMVKSLKNELYIPLTLIINQMLHTGIYPNGFKIAKVIPIFKKGDPSLLTNYRPISLLPTLSKVFERANSLNCILSSSQILICVSSSMGLGQGILPNWLQPN